MTDDSSLTPGGEMTTKTLVTVRHDIEGHWVEWTKDGENGRLGPYTDSDVAEKVRSAKEHELNENPGHIDDARAGRPDTSDRLI